MLALLLRGIQLRDVKDVVMAVKFGISGFYGNMGTAVPDVPGQLAGMIQHTAGVITQSFLACIFVDLGDPAVWLLHMHLIGHPELKPYSITTANNHSVNESESNCNSAHANYESHLPNIHQQATPDFR